MTDRRRMMKMLENDVHRLTETVNTSEERVDQLQQVLKTQERKAVLLLKNDQVSCERDVEKEEALVQVMVIFSLGV